MQHNWGVSHPKNSSDISKRRQFRISAGPTVRTAMQWFFAVSARSCSDITSELDSTPFHSMLLPTFFFFHNSTALVGIGLLTLEVSRSHSDTPRSVGLLRTSDLSVAETYTLTILMHKGQTSMPPTRLELRSHYYSVIILLLDTVLSGKLKCIDN
jgi:hypothetical protein